VEKASHGRLFFQKEKMFAIPKGFGLANNVGRATTFADGLGVIGVVLNILNLKLNLFSC
jgi:hypothetical protein